MQDDMTQGMERAAILRKHWNFQRLLKPVGVKNSFGHRLSYGDERLQGRRIPRLADSHTYEAGMGGCYV